MGWSSCATLDRSVIQQQIVKTAANIDKESWIGVNANELLLQNVCPTKRLPIVNDADAAALPELKLGAAKDTGRTRRSLDNLVLVSDRPLCTKAFWSPTQSLGTSRLKGSDSEHHAAAAVAN